MSEEFKPGDKVPQSGIYKVNHDGHHEAHEVTCIMGNTFPPCKNCKHTTFELVRAAHHIEAHEHFKKH